MANRRNEKFHFLLITRRALWHPRPAVQQHIITMARWKMSTRIEFFFSHRSGEWAETVQQVIILLLRRRRKKIEMRTKFVDSRSPSGECNNFYISWHVPNILFSERTTHRVVERATDDSPAIIKCFISKTSNFLFLFLFFIRPSIISSLSRFPSSHILLDARGGSSVVCGKNYWKK